MIHVTMIQIKSGDETAEFQTMHFTKCFERWCNRWAHYIKSEGDYFQEGENL
jgi:hypothetical protein